MTGNSAQFIGLLMRQLTGVQGSIAHINANLGKMAILAGGAVAAFAGFEALKGIWHLVEASKELNNELIRTRQLGGEFASSIGATRHAAFATAAEVPTFAPSELVRMQRELGSQLQSPEAAIAVLPQAAKAAAVIHQQTGEDQEAIIKNLVKLIDLRAKLFSTDASGKEYIDQAKFGPELQAATQALILGSAYMKSSDLLTMARQGGLPIKTMTTEAFYAEQTEMGISQGFARAGTALTSLFSQLVGGIMPARVAKEMVKEQLLKPGEFTIARGGSVSLAPAATQRLQGAMQDPIAYITGPLNELMTKQGKTDQEKLLEIFRLFGRQTTQRFVGEALSAAPQFERARAMFKNIGTIQDMFKIIQQENLEFNITAFSKSWTGLMQALGDAGIPSAISILQMLTNGLHELTAMVEAHPDAARHLLELSAVLAGLLAVGGTITVATIALSGLLIPLRALAGIAGGMGIAASGIGLVARAMGALTAVAWVGLATGAKEAASGLGLLIGALSRIAGPLALAYGILHPSRTQGPDVDYPGGMKGASPASPGQPIGPQSPGLALPRGQSAPENHPRSLWMPGGGDGGGGDKGSQQHGDVYLDGKKVGQVLWPHLANEISRPASGSNNPDIRQSPLYPGVSGNWSLA